MATGYYVTLRRDTRDGIKTAWLLGPFACHKKAKETVDAAASHAENIDPRCHWDARGTASITLDDGHPLPPGKLNKELSHLLAEEG